MTDRRSLLLPGIVAALAFAVLIALGVWQIERKAWKENLIATLAQRMATAPSPLAPRGEWQNLTPPADEFRRVRLRAQLDPENEARVYSGGAGLRDDVKTPGYFAFTPARLADGSTVVVNRGHVDNPNPDAALKPIAVPDGAADIVGALRWPGAARLVRHALFGAAGPVVRARPPRDGGALRLGRGGAVLHRDGEPGAAGGVPRPGALTVKLRNDHLGYALTWFGLAAVLLGVFGFWAVRRRADA